MTAVIPLTLDNDGNLVQMSSSTILDYQQRAIVNFARDPSVSLAEITTGGSLNSMIDTRRKAGPARGTEDSALNDPTTINSITFDKINLTRSTREVIADSNFTKYPLYYESDGSTDEIKIRHMSQTDFEDTFIKPAITLLVAGATLPEKQGSFYITTNASNSENVSSQPIFTDTIADLAKFDSGPLPEPMDQPSIIQNYYLAKHGVDSSLQPTDPDGFLFADSIAPGQFQIRQSTGGEIDHYLEKAIYRVAAFDTTGSKIDYEICDSNNHPFGGVTRGSLILDKQIVSQRISSSLDSARYGDSGYGGYTGYGYAFQAIPYGDSGGTNAALQVNNTYQLRIKAT